MSFFSITILFLTVVVCAQAVNIPTPRILTNAQRADLQRRVAAVGGCNANVCFALDGSKSVTRQGFRAEKDFVLDVGAVIGVDDALEAAACQFGLVVSPIQPLTPNLRRFNRKVAGASFLNDRETFLVGGINYCFSQLARRRGEANKIVVLGDGGSTIGSSAIRRANLFRSIGGEVCAVGAGFTDDFELLAIAGGDPNKVFNVNSFLDVLELQKIIENLVAGICNLPSE